MKYIFFVLLLFCLASCSEIEKKTSGIEKNYIPEIIRSKKCFGYNKIEIFQVVADGALANVCSDDNSIDGDEFRNCYKGDIVFLEVEEKDNDFVDNQKLKLPDDKCFMANGRLAYTANNGMNKVIRKIKIIDAYIKNPTKKN